MKRMYAIKANASPKSRQPIILLLVGLFLSISQASAYIDPGTASMVWQLILATSLGIAYAVRLHWAKIKETFRKKFGKSKSAE